MGGEGWERDRGMQIHRERAAPPLSGGERRASIGAPHCIEGARQHCHGHAQPPRVHGGHLRPAIVGGIIAGREKGTTACRGVITRGAQVPYMTE